MEVKPGYKQTDVGVIPDGWEVTKIGTAGQVLGGRQRSPHNTGELCKYLRVANVFDGYVDTSDVLEMPFTTKEKERFLLRDGDILLNEGQSLELVGRSAIYRGQPSDCCFQNTLVRFRANEGTIPEFAQVVFQRYLVTGVFASIASQTTSIAHLGSGRFANLPFPVPPLPEQRAIAAALGDVDALLALLDQSIVKKRDLKQAAMQQLLTGQTRLPGFRGEWEKKTLGEIGDCVIGLTYQPEDVVEHGTLVLRASNIQDRKLSYEDCVFVEKTIPPHLFVREGDILVCVRNGSRALIGKCVRLDKDAAGHSFGAFMSVFRTPHSRFLVHVFQSNIIQRQIHENIGATINQITNKDMKSFRVELPPVEEQMAIAEVLSDMDAEIAALEDRRDKTKLLKEGMMQELLTGRTRLL